MMVIMHIFPFEQNGQYMCRSYRLKIAMSLTSVLLLSCVFKLTYVSLKNTRFMFIEKYDRGVKDGLEIKCNWKDQNLAKFTKNKQQL